MYYNLVRHLPAVGVDVRGLVVGEPLRPDEGVRAFAPADAPLPVRLWRARRAAADALAGGAVDVVASHFALYTFPFLDLVRDRPLVVHFHGPWASESAAEGGGGAARRVRHAVEAAVYRRADRVVVLSEAFGGLVQETYGVAAHRVRLVPGGTEVDRFDVPVSRAGARRRLGWPEDRPVLLSVRRLARRMGLEALVDAVGLLRAEVPDVLLLMAGRGPIAEELEARVAEAGLGGHVRLLGFVPDDDLPLAYRAATASVVPTRALEGFGLITAESLAAGTPVFVTPVGGLPEAVSALSRSLVFPSGSVRAMAAHLGAALQGRLPLPSADACRAYARDRFDWSTVARRTRAVYEEVTHPTSP